MCGLIQWSLRKSCIPGKKVSLIIIHLTKLNLEYCIVFLFCILKLIVCTPGEGLKGNRSLQYLCIQNCSIGHHGFGTISEALVHNTTLIVLNVNGNRIGNNGISLLCMLTAPHIQKI